MNVYVARKSCGCIVAAFPINIDRAVKGELLKQLAKGGYDVDQTTEFDVRENFSLSCDHNKPPLLSLMDDAAEGVDQEDVEAAGSEDLTPDGSADDLLDSTAEEEAEEIQAEIEEESIEATASQIPF